MEARLQQAMEVRLEQEFAAMEARLQQAMEVRLEQEFAALSAARAELVDGGLMLSEELRLVKAAVRALEQRQETRTKMSCSQQARCLM